ncbi:MAG: TonB-dependent receptor plug domain-containing protein, partial [Hyphomonadaceae bacterium]
MVQRGERLAFAAPGGLAAALWCLGLGPAYAQSDELAQLRGLSIEQLSNLEVTSVSRRAESIAGAPAAIDVITNEDIRRSGAQTLPEALRLARNLQVARVDAQRYAISARGFNSFAAANKLLVLVDGRSIYTPLYSGVFWDQHHVMLDNVERIEVISGPGGALWGANAVNGVINVITRPAEETQGILVNGFAGSLDQRLDLQYGGQAGEFSYRIFAGGFDRAASLLPGGDEADDAWRGGFIGFRTDWGDLQDSFMLQGQLFASDNGGQGDRDGGHLLGHGRRLLEDGSSVEVQTYYSQSGAETVGVTDALEVWDIEAQHAFSLGSAHQIVWGGGYRYSESAFATFANPSRLVQEERGLRTLSAFIQDEIALRQNLALTLGLKAEDHTFTGLEYMPSVRVAWRPGGEHLVWAAVSRGAR